MGESSLFCCIRVVEPRAKTLTTSRPRARKRPRLHGTGVLSSTRLPTGRSCLGLRVPQLSKAERGHGDYNRALARLRERECRADMVYWTEARACCNGVGPPGKDRHSANYGFYMEDLISTAAESGSATSITPRAKSVGVLSVSCAAAANINSKVFVAQHARFFTAAFAPKKEVPIKVPGARELCKSVLEEAQSPGHERRWRARAACPFTE